MLKYHLILDETKRPNPNDLLMTDFFKFIRVDTDNSFAIVNLDLVIGHGDDLNPNMMEQGSSKP